MLDVLDDCAGNLAAARHRFQRQELPDEFEFDDSELLRPAEQARHVAAQLETCADTLRNESGQTGDADMPAD